MSFSLFCCKCHPYFSFVQKIIERAPFPPFNFFAALLHLSTKTGQKIPFFKRKRRKKATCDTWHANIGYKEGGAFESSVSLISQISSRKDFYVPGQQKAQASQKGRNK